MSGDIPSPVARRIGRPSWRDPRLGIGLLLVVGSVALGTWAVSGAQRGVAVYAADGVLTPGDALDAAALSVVEATVPQVAGVYLPADEPLPADAVVTRVVGRGELVPAGAVGSGEDVDVRPVGVPVTGPLGSGVTKGALVDLWLTVPPTTAVGAPPIPAAPTLVAGELRVAEVTASDDVFAAAGSTSVQVLVPRAQLPAVLAALAGDGGITLVPVPGGA